jgi:hypothetical protein
MTYGFSKTSGALARHEADAVSAGLEALGSFMICLEMAREDAQVQAGVRALRNLSTEESRDFWARCQRSAVKVAGWPAWKRVGINVGTVRQEPRSHCDHCGGDRCDDAACYTCATDRYCGDAKPCGWCK